MVLWKQSWWRPRLMSILRYKVLSLFLKSYYTDHWLSGSQIKVMVEVGIHLVSTWYYSSLFFELVSLLNGILCDQCYSLIQFSDLILSYTNAFQKYVDWLDTKTLGTLEELKSWPQIANPLIVTWLGIPLSADTTRDRSLVLVGHLGRMCP